MHMRYSNPLDAGPGLTSDSRKWSRQAGSVMVMFTLMLFVLVPLVGLAIDGTMMYSVKAKLQAAVDGGAIAAAQSLKSGINFTAQKATAEKTADQFIKANIVVSGTGYSGYWGAYNLNDTHCDVNGQPVTGGASPCIVAAEDNLNKRRTVSVAASVQVPLLFMRILGFSSGTVGAKGMAARRDVVMILVLDRSSSMTPALQALKDGATYFVSQFQSGRDRVGLVAFGGSAIVAYPPSDWNKAVPTGPDTAFKDTPDSASSPNILTSISNIAIGSNTGSAEALMLAYKELVAANQPGALNVIVFFTDGLPNGITANFNNNTGTAVIKAGSPCTYKPTNLGVAAHSMVGWMAQVNGYVSGPVGATDGRGIFSLAQTTVTATQNSVTNWLIHGNEPVLASGSGQPANNCSYAGNQANIPTDLTIPRVDYYGNSTSGSGTAPYTSIDYQQSEIWGNECNNANRTNLNLTKPGDACQVGLASWNAADMAGKQIRADTTLTPVIYTMGYEGDGGDDPVLMRRLSNVKGASSVYDATKPEGLYLPILTVNDISPAFQRVMSEILRLTM
jgi:Flp pilus assembly protein TadG